ncbi:iron chelate uptake ABC transporter family permease subunit [Nakamurella sp. YIM 132087]|uniref:Iron chelate uptake ABC transporter family permease subunit n=1 Tax=Nakamurella alba TaxID=2665158 RepID=A0A7K1FT21_9ACTN|nr:iron chelate uptake ABC transporter family permease subunit [Nakamurella alba]MTD17278.1 iron chelate uptake ABC transporter family permease subunit [Nakamurella alba]
MTTTGLDSPRPAAPGVDPAAPKRSLVEGTANRLVVCLVALVVLVLLGFASLFVGSGEIPASVVWEALRGDRTDTLALLVTDYRIPRAMIAVLVGCALGVGGALIQAITRNPLADPGLLGVNSGSFFAVVLSVTISGTANLSSYVWWSFLGAAVAAVSVYVIGSRGSGATPVKLVLAGLAFGAVLNGITYAVTFLDPDVFDKIRFWQSGSLQGRQIDTFWWALPFVVVGVLTAVLLSRSLNALALGEDLAKSLGVHLFRTRAIAMGALTLLCGAATAAVGPIAFLGLMVPYLARVVARSDQRWIVPLSALFGPVIFLGADVLGRVLVPSEMPVGVVVAFLGAPVLVAVVRTRKKSGL